MTGPEMRGAKHWWCFSLLSPAAGTCPWIQAFYHLPLPTGHSRQTWPIPQILHLKYNHVSLEVVPSSVEHSDATDLADTLTAACETP